MNVSGIRPISGFYNVTNASVINDSEVVSRDLATQSKEADGVSLKHDAPKRDTSKQTFNSADLAKQYDSRKTYSLKGEKSDIRTLDVENAISAMQKDSALQQYQYFVGNKVNQTAEANVLRAVENFEI
ncbi:MAG: hypothetical protein K5851_07510 [Lachnospiraceae bacterium]|nr:hypothetical protein [Lachnospiraceae bacterium]